MDPERARIDAFLATKRIAFVGVSSHKEHFSRTVMQAMLDEGIDVVPVNRAGGSIEGRTAYRHVSEIEPPVGAALIMTPAAQSEAAVRDCVSAGVPRIWLHRGSGTGSVSEGAVEACEEAGVEVVAGRCPLMFLGEHPHLVHRMHRGFERLRDRYPEGRYRPASFSHRVLVAFGWGAVGWGVCSLIMVIAMVTMSTESAVVVHALMAPLAFFFLAFAYHRVTRPLTPVWAAIVFVATVFLLDLTLISGLVLGSFELFSSLIGFWGPLAAIGVASWAAGIIARTPRVSQLASGRL